MKALVLAAGEGVRMRPLTLTRSKHMIPLVGKPLLEHVLKALRESGISDVVLVVGYKKELIHEYFGDGSSLGIRINYVSQDEPLGTANAIQLAKDQVEKEVFLTIYGDLLLTSKSIRAALQAYDRSNATTLCVVSVENPEQYGIVKLEKKDVVAIVEKPKREEAPSNLANAGIYVFTDEIFKKIKAISRSRRAEYEITDAIRCLIENKVPVVAVKIESEDWMDIGRPWDLLEANKRILQKTKLEIAGEVEEGVRLLGPVGLAKNARIRSGAYVEGPTFINEGSDIGPNCLIRPYTSLGKKVRIGNACEIKNSIILDGTHVGHLSYIGDSIIGERCNFGAGTITANLRLDEKPVKVMVKDELINSGRRKLGVIMGDHVKTAIHVSFMAGVKVGPNSWIGPDVTVYRDVPAGVFLLKKQRLERRKILE